MKILFYDCTTPSAYTYSTLQTQAMGGTEATIIRIAHGLSSFHEVFIAQHSRQRNVWEKDVNYISLIKAHQLQPDCVIVLRDPAQLEIAGNHFKNAKLFFWMHNTPPADLFYARKYLIKYNYEIIAVSHFLKELIEKRLKGKWFQRLMHSNQASIPVYVLYNPIADDLIPDGTLFDPNKLLFLSSPQKGLKETLAMFERLRKYFPEYQLYVANPGHRQLTFTFPENVIVLGSLPHHEMIQHLRNAFCVFYPQHLKAETFGLIYAEANAVGTPLLAHCFGAAPEVLSDSDQFVDGADFSAIKDKITAWREQRIQVGPNEKFRLKNIIPQWLDLVQS